MPARLPYVGRLDESGTNVVLFPTWFSGRSRDLVGFLGPERLVDTTRYFVVLVDAFGNGVSSSPSNSERQPGRQFPAFTIRDMVNAQHRLLTEHLGVRRLHAVIGISMGGMQAFEWAVSHPEFVSRAVPIAGTPRQTAFDLLLWETQLQAIEMWGDDPTARQVMRVIAGIHSLALETPESVSERPADDFEEELDAREAGSISSDPFDWASQLQAMIHHDIYDRFDGDARRAGAHIKARMLVIVDEQDHMVNPRPAKEFARQTGARLVAFDTKCGHLIFSCSAYEVNAVVSRFLGEEAGP